MPSLAVIARERRACSRAPQCWQEEPQAMRMWMLSRSASLPTPQRRWICSARATPCRSVKLFLARSRSNSIRSVVVSWIVVRKSWMPAANCTPVRLAPGPKGAAMRLSPFLVAITEALSPAVSAGIPVVTGVTPNTGLLFTSCVTARRNQVWRGAQRALSAANPGWMKVL